MQPTKKVFLNVQIPESTRKQVKAYAALAELRIPEAVSDLLLKGLRFASSEKPTRSATSKAVNGLGPMGPA